MKLGRGACPAVHNASLLSVRPGCAWHGEATGSNPLTAGRACKIHFAHAAQVFMMTVCQTTDERPFVRGYSFFAFVTCRFAGDAEKRERCIRGRMEPRVQQVAHPTSG